MNAEDELKALERTLTTFIKELELQREHLSHVVRKSRRRVG
jgi:hypothetical protein